MNFRATKLMSAIKTILLVMVAIGSSFLTSTILGQVRSSNGKKPSGARTAAVKSQEIRELTATTYASVTTYNNGAVQDPSPSKRPASTVNKAIKSPSIFASSLNSMGVDVKGKTVVISAETSLTDTRPSIVYMWSLSVKNTRTNHKILDLYYDEQMFSILNSGEVHPSFNEEFPLPPGTYRVELCLYALSTKTDMIKFKADPEFAVNHLSLRGIKYIHVLE